MKNNEQGAILITVAVLTLIMMILVVSVISLNVSQIKSNRHQAERIKAEQLAKQVFWENYTSLSATGNTAYPDDGTPQPPVTIDGKTYIFRLTRILPDPDPATGTTRFDVQVDYPHQ